MRLPLATTVSAVKIMSPLYVSLTANIFSCAMRSAYSDGFSFGLCFSSISGDIIKFGIT
jgi:hypothetical protein